MVGRGRETEKALATIKHYMKGVMEVTDEGTDEASESSEDGDADWSDLLLSSYIKQALNNADTIQTFTYTMFTLRYEYLYGDINDQLLKKCWCS